MVYLKSIEGILKGKVGFSKIQFLHQHFASDGFNVSLAVPEHTQSTYLRLQWISFFFTPVTPLLSCNMWYGIQSTLSFSLSFYPYEIFQLRERNDRNSGRSEGDNWKKIKEARTREIVTIVFADIISVGRAAETTVAINSSERNSNSCTVVVVVARTAAKGTAHSTTVVKTIQAGKAATRSLVIAKRETFFFFYLSGHGT